MSVLYLFAFNQTSMENEAELLPFFEDDFTQHRYKIYPKIMQNHDLGGSWGGSGGHLGPKGQKTKKTVVPGLLLGSTLGGSLAPASRNGAFMLIFRCFVWCL